jgi:glycosyltransferase involved in cell wall biosynthesis
MISALIPTLDSERHLVPVLSALVAGSAAGLLREVILADGGSTDGTERIAEAAGCNFRKEPGSERERLLSAAAGARGTWLLVLGSKSALEEGWTREVAKFIESPDRPDQAASFRLAIDDYGFAPRLREIASAARGALTGRPAASQGLLISKSLYRSSRGKPGRVIFLRTRVVIPA